MKKIILTSLISFSVVAGLCYSNESVNHTINSFSTKSINQDSVVKNVIPDDETAKEIAEAIWIPLYGERVLKQKPYKCKLTDGVWVVEGLIPSEYRNNPDYRGGTAYIEIRAMDCKILDVGHSK